MHRIIGEYANRDGPTLFCAAGIHGSEPAGVVAAQRVFEYLDSRSIPVRGTFVAARGNVTALTRGIRYIDRDLNRMWDDREVARILADDAPPLVENRELKPLVNLLQRAIDGSPEPILFVDLHTTSSESVPFIYSVPSLNAETNLPRFHIPIVTDPLFCISGTMGHYVARRGQQVIIAEGGHHDHHSSIEYCESVLWLALVMAGCVRQSDLEATYHRATEMLQEAGEDVPRYFEVVFRHRVSEGDGFHMRPNYHNFQPIRQHEVLAEDAKGKILAPVDGWILMPLYRPPCDDGFLVVQEKHHLSFGALAR